MIPNPAAVVVALSERAPDPNAPDTVQQQDGRILRALTLRFLFTNPRTLRIAGTLLRWYRTCGLQGLIRRSGILERIPRLRELESKTPVIADHTASELIEETEHPSDPRYRVLMLTGCVQDARETVSWLRSIDVPADRIRMHLGAAGAAPDHEGVAALGATRDQIWASIAEMQAWEGERLFVILSGHGYYLPDHGPIFLAQDWSRTFSTKNLAINAYADFFQSLLFRNVIFVVDACANYDVDPTYRSAIVPLGPENAKALPNPANAVTLCCAASQGQLAPVVEGRGLMLRRLLEVLKEAPDRKSTRLNSSHTDISRMPSSA